MDLFVTGAKNSARLLRLRTEGTGHTASSEKVVAYQYPGDELFLVTSSLQYILATCPLGSCGDGVAHTSRLQISDCRMAGVWLERPATEARSQICLHYKLQTFSFLHDWPGCSSESGVRRGDICQAKEMRNVGTNSGLLVPGGPALLGKVL